MKKRLPKPLRQLLARQAHEQATLPQGAVQAVKPAMVAARRDMAASLTQWLEGRDLEAPVTLTEYRAILTALRKGAMPKTGRPPKRPAWQAGLERDLKRGLLSGRDQARDLATRHATQEATALKIRGPRGVMALPSPERLTAKAARLTPRLETIAQRAAASVMDDTRARVAQAVLRGDTIGQFARRLGGTEGGVVLTDSAAVGENMAATIVERFQNIVQRIANTELYHAYNTTKLDAMEEIGDANQVLILKRWNALMDKSTCELCAELDGDTVPVDEEFGGGEGLYNPPAHPGCHCTCDTIVEEDNRTGREGSYPNEPTAALPDVGLSVSVTGGGRN